MSALEETLVRLLADAPQRKRFLSDRERFCAEIGLPAPERRMLLGISPEALERYARSLLDKRVSELLSAIPVTARAFPQVGDLYRAWLGRIPAPCREDTLTPGLREALRAVKPLAPLVEPEWLSELFVYEVLRGCSLRDRKPRTLRARWPQAELYAMLTGGEIPLDPDEDPHTYRFP